ncbi:MAG: DUF503 domain-containing protein [Planctomycetota bacterium]|nr:MAG: DUF503 domain-containing protein [Planctomycetota bacterium]
MVVGLLRVRLAVFESLSLKDKRRVVKSLKDRLHGRHNVSVAEVDDLDSRQMATLAVAMIANDARFIDAALRKIVDEIRGSGRSSLVDYHIEMM